MSILYTAHATVKNGRDGSVRTDDGKLELALAFPESLGGSGKGTNPEQLFAAGYGACFASTLANVAKAEGELVRNVQVDSAVDLHFDAVNYDLGVRLTVRAEGVDQATLDALVEKAKAACPYSRATRNNVITSVKASTQGR
ncbi:MAG: Ohr family peroxiredoxin [Polyangiaceae bacterium]|nr:Ohr family peroxiredoxin [Polyangiaceae bacterium]